MLVYLISRNNDEFCVFVHPWTGGLRSCPAGCRVAGGRLARETDRGSIWKQNSWPTTPRSCAGRRRGQSCPSGGPRSAEVDHAVRHGGSSLPFIDNDGGATGWKPQVLPRIRPCRLRCLRQADHGFEPDRQLSVTHGGAVSTIFEAEAVPVYPATRPAAGGDLSTRVSPRRRLPEGGHAGGSIACDEKAGWTGRRAGGKGRQLDPYLRVLRAGRRCRPAVSANALNKVVLLAVISGEACAFEDFPCK